MLHIFIGLLSAISCSPFYLQEQPSNQKKILLFTDFVVCFHVSARGSHNLVKKRSFSYFPTLFDPALHLPITSGSDLLLPQLNWKQRNRVESAGTKKKEWQLSLCSFRESVSPLRCWRYKRRPVTGLRGDILSPSLVCIGWNNPFLSGLILPAPRCGPVQLRLQLDYCAGLWG